MTRLAWHRGAELPTLRIWWVDSDGDLVDLSAATFSLKIGQTGSTATVTKTTGIAGAVGAGTAPTGTPNVVVTWAASELDIAAGAYTAQLTATISSLQRIIEFPVQIQAVIS